jgi:hypothetical protein
MPPLRALRRPSLAALAALLVSCDRASDPAAHPLGGAWRGDAAFTPSVSAYRATHATVAFTVAEDGTLAGSMRTDDGEAAAVAGTVARDGALRVRIDRFSVDGQLHRAPRDRATGSGVQRDGATAVGVISLDVGRP